MWRRVAGINGLSLVKGAEPRLDVLFLNIAPRHSIDLAPRVNVKLRAEQERDAAWYSATSSGGCVHRSLTTRPLARYSPRVYPLGSLFEVGRIRN